VLIAAFAAFMLSSGFTVTGALLASPASTYGYAYAPAPVAGYATPMMPPPPPLMPRVAAPPLAPALATNSAMPVMAASSVDHIAARLRQAGDAGRRVTVVGTTRNVGTTFTAITLARTLAKSSNVVLVDLAFGAPNMSVISSDPNAAGIAELVRGTASFGDIITRDQYSRVHLVATGNVGSDGAALAASPMLATVIEGLVRSYDHVVIDVGAASDIAVERFAPLATQAVLVTGDPGNPVTRATRDRMMMAGFGEVAVLAGGAQAAAA
jgi:polysaccharide biosynthesis transport protein